MSDGDVYPLAILIDELKHDDIATRVAAMKRLPTVALALGEERSRDELVPFLLDVTKEDEDEILTVLGEQLADFSEYIGGKQYLYTLLDVLANLAVSEEPVVRETAIKSLCAIARDLPNGHVEEHFVPLVFDLAQSDWFSSRIAAAGLFPVTLECLHAAAADGAEGSAAATAAGNAAAASAASSGSSPAAAASSASSVNSVKSGTVKSGEALDAANEESVDARLFKAYGLLINDEAPMVRRSAGANFPDVIKSVPAKELQHLKVLEMFIQLCQDDQDSVKLLAVDVAIALLAADSSSFSAPLVEPVFQLLDNKSWRVRYQSADRFAKLAGNFTLSGDEEKAELHTRFLQVFVRLTSDPEAEVRTGIAKQAVLYCPQLTCDEIVQQVVPNLENLTNDVSESVREALAGNIAGIAPIIGKENTVQCLLPIFLQMLRDEHSEVRLSIISSLDVINEVIGVDKLGESLLPAISDLAKDKQWRVLLAVIEYSPLLAKQLGVDFFNKELVPLVITWLWDPVWAIRDAAAANLLNLADVFGVQWLETEIVPKLVNFHNVGSGYLTRFTALLAIKRICPRLSMETLVDVVLPLVSELSADPVPNVRFNCASTCAIIASRIAKEKPQLCESEILPLITKLVEDEDMDVRFYAQEALRGYNECVA